MKLIILCCLYACYHKLTTCLLCSFCKPKSTLETAVMYVQFTNRHFSIYYIIYIHFVHKETRFLFYFSLSHFYSKVPRSKIFPPIFNSIGKFVKLWCAAQNFPSHCIRYIVPMTPLNPQRHHKPKLLSSDPRRYYIHSFSTIFLTKKGVWIQEACP